MLKENEDRAQTSREEIAMNANFPGENLVEVSLENRNIRVEIANIGCAITAIYTPDRAGKKKNIVAGFPGLQQYWTNRDYFGVVVGRYANRIAGGNFSLEGRPYQLTINDGVNHLHGGRKGFSHQLWTLSAQYPGQRPGSARFLYNSADGEEGYPGDLSVSVEYVLDPHDRLSILYEAVTNKTTPVNLTNHSYFNLTGFEHPTILDHELMVNAHAYTEKGPDNISTGVIKRVDHTALDFRRARKIGEGTHAFPGDRGYDHNLVLQKGPGDQYAKAAVLSEQTTGRMVTLYTDRPAMQVYTANHWDGTIVGKQGHPYGQHGGIALETQAYPGSVHYPHFPDTLLHPGEVYRSVTVFEFGITGSHNDNHF